MSGGPRGVRAVISSPSVCSLHTAGAASIIESPPFSSKHLPARSGLRALAWPWPVFGLRLVVPCPKKLPEMAVATHPELQAALRRKPSAPPPAYSPVKLFAAKRRAAAALGTLDLRCSLGCCLVPSHALSCSCSRPSTLWPLDLLSRSPALAR